MTFKDPKFLIIGVDPGLTGAIAAIDEAGKLIAVHDTPVIQVKKAQGKKTVYLEAEMAKILATIQSCYQIRLVGLENVHAMPKQGTVSVFSFGTGFGIWLGILAALKLPYERIEPGKWKRDMGLTSGSDKNASIVKALQLFPTASLNRKRDEGRAESLLLAEYLRRRMTVGS